MRQEQAEQTRSRVISAAGRLFAEHGYARTTLNKIADAAGVSAETVQGYGPKAALLIAAIEYAAVGVAGEENILNLEVGKRFVAIEDPVEALDYLVEVAVGNTSANGRPRAGTDRRRQRRSRTRPLQDGHVGRHHRPNPARPHRLP